MECPAASSRPDRHQTPARVLRRGPRARQRTDRRPSAISTSTTASTGSRGRRCHCSSTSPGPRTWSAVATKCSPACTSTPPRTARCCTWRCGCRKGTELIVDGQNVVADVHEVLDRMGDFTDRLRNGEWTGATGERITTVVNIGIGGSDLGPVMVYQALRHYADAGISARFVSNVDPADLVATLGGPRPGEDAVHRRVEDVLDAGDADQRDRRAPVADGRARRRRGVQALRRGVDEPASSSTTSASTPTTCSGSGTGSAAGTRWTRRSGCR